MVLSLQIDPSGDVKKVRIVESLSLNLDHAAVACVRTWKFTLKRGNPEFLPDDFEF